MCLGGFLFQWSAAWVCHTCLKMIYTAHRTYTDDIQCTTECASLQCQSSAGLYFSLNLLYFVFPSVFIVKSNVLTIRQVIKKEKVYTVILLQIFFFYHFHSTLFSDWFCSAFLFIMYWQIQDFAKVQGQLTEQKH